MQATDTSSIQRLIGQARGRIRRQWALEGATTALILASAAALATVFAMRIDAVSTWTGVGLLIGCAGIVLVGAVIGALRPIDDEAVARRIDRASGLSDRLSTAIAFKRTLGSANAEGADETEDLMVAAIKDGVRAVPRADITAAAPYTEPKDLRAAAVFVVVSALAAGLMIPREDYSPHLYKADPDHARPGEITLIRGDNLMTGLKPSEAHDAGRFVPSDGSVLLGPSDKARPMTVLNWTAAGITIRVPDDAPIGDSVLYVIIGEQKLGPLEFTVVDLKDTRYHKEDSVLLDPDERAYVERILEQLRMVAKRDNVPEFEEFADKIEQMLKEAEEGKITKEQLLEALKKAEEALAKNAEPNQAEVNKQMSEMGKELSKDQTTKDLGDALQKNDLEKAKEELEKLANRLDPEEMKKEIEKLEKQLENKQLSEKEKQEIQKQLDELKKQMEQAKKEQEALEKMQKDLEKQIKELEEKLKDKNLSEKEKAELQKKLDELKKQLEQAEQKQQDAAKKQNELEEQKQELKKQLENKQLSEQEKQELQKKLEELKNQKPLTEKEKEQLQKQMEKVSSQMKQQDKQQQEKMEQQQQKLQDEIKRLQKKQEEAKTEKEKLDAERQLQKKKDELQKLDKDNQDKNDSAQREAVKRLQRDMEKAAENLEKPKPDPNKSKDEQDKEQQEREKQASKKLKDAARETGRVDQDQRKQAAQKKMSSQMDDLREAMRRAKQKGSKGPQDPFGKQGKNKDFAQRARGQKGSGQAWKPGQGQQGQGKGQGQGQQPGGQGQGQGGDSWGTGHDDNLVGDSTGKTGKTKDDDLQGQQGGKGTSRRQTILSAAQKGFASTSYKKVYADYEKIVEEVMRNEKMPSSYKYYVKRYFAKIHPSTGDSSTQDTP
ncbi:MAG: hypothetical protein H0T46_27025 [Deltaproteobacteria bacterium]|nr:hypothetical protein [Deltaproteobacteria bacterium]